tara:strand:+ start:1139 stop:1972 length:834 start_codon:yes stop_codon:yes gene_type:complete
MTNLTFLEYTLEESSRLWHNRHLRMSVMKAERFSKFADYDTRKIGDFKPRHIHAFLDHLTDECELTNNTANHYCAMLIKVFKQAFNNQDIERVPNFTWKKAGRTHRMTFFTPPQVNELVKYFRAADQDTWMADMVLIAANTGMRLGEIRSITPNRVFENENGKPYVHLEDTKNGDERYVYLNEKSKYALLNLDNQPEKYFRMWKFYRAWGAMRKDLLQGDKLYVFHSLRHTFATRLANEFKLNNTVIAAMMGHRSLVTTSKYVKMMPEVQINVCDAF